MANRVKQAAALPPEAGQSICTTLLAQSQDFIVLRVAEATSGAPVRVRSETIAISINALHAPDDRRNHE